MIGDTDHIDAWSNGYQSTQAHFATREFTFLDSADTLIQRHVLDNEFDLPGITEKPTKEVIQVALPSFSGKVKPDQARLSAILSSKSPPDGGTSKMKGRERVEDVDDESRCTGRYWQVPVYWG